MEEEDNTYWSCWRPPGLYHRGINDAIAEFILLPIEDEILKVFKFKRVEVDLEDFTRALESMCTRWAKSHYELDASKLDVKLASQALAYAYAGNNVIYRYEEVGKQLVSSKEWALRNKPEWLSKLKENLCN